MLGLRKRIIKTIKSNKELYKMAWFLKKMPLKQTLRREISGSENKLISPISTIFNNCEIYINGGNNTITIGEMCLFNNVKFYIRGNNNNILIGKNVSFDEIGDMIIEDNDGTININDNTSFQGTHLAVTEPGSKITIGTDCMFANHIDVRTGDSHSIIDTVTNKRINYAKDVVIGNHVWVAAHCSILKGVTILDNCIIATRSVVTKSFNVKGAIIGGSPARVLKENVTWLKERIYDN